MFHCMCPRTRTLARFAANPPFLSRHSPVPTITWRKINGNIPKKARLRKSQAVLEIPNIQLEDSGTYECKAENPRGGTAFKGHLQVYSESEPRKKEKSSFTALSGRTRAAAGRRRTSSLIYLLCSVSECVVIAAPAGVITSRPLCTHKASIDKGAS